MSEKDWILKYFAPTATTMGADHLRNDVAVLGNDGRLIVTADALVEGVHFLPSDPLSTVAQKLVRVNVSDCLASGARPKEAILTLGWPASRSEAELAEFASALGQEMGAWGISLLGGDTVSHAGALFLSLTLTGMCLGEGPVSRAGAHAGDDIWLTGKIGGAKLGFDALGDDRPSEFVADYRAPRLPEPEISALIAAHATASMDVSDGLLGDALVLARQSESKLDLDLDAVKFAGEPKNTEEKLALATWGDDYQCLFTATAESRAAIENWADKAGQELSRIGSVSAGEGITVTSCGIRINLPDALGFEHN